MKIVITKKQYGVLVSSLLKTLFGKLRIKTIEEQKAEGFDAPYHVVFDSEGEVIIGIYIKKSANAGCKNDLTIFNETSEKLEAYIPHYRHKIFSEVIVDYVYKQLDIKCDCVQYEYDFKWVTDNDEDEDEYDGYMVSKTRKYNLKKKKKIKESTEGKSSLEKLIYSFLQDDFYPDYNWGPELFDFYKNDVEEYGSATFYINDSEGYVYYDDGTLEIMPWVCEKLNEYFNDSWVQVFKDWFEEHSGLKVKMIVDSTNNNRLLDESIDKNKKLLNGIIGFDFTGRIEQITSSYDVPMNFDECLYGESINRYLNFWGPMYLFELDDVKYLYQDRGEFEFFMDEGCREYVDDEIPEKLGIAILGLRFSDIIDMYFEEE
jgi:hypothetical protein